MIGRARWRRALVPLAVELRGCRHDLLYRIVAEGLAALRSALANADRSLPAHVERELEKCVTSPVDPGRGYPFRTREHRSGQR